MTLPSGSTAWATARDDLAFRYGELNATGPHPLGSCHKVSAHHGRQTAASTLGINHDLQHTIAEAPLRQTGHRTLVPRRAQELLAKGPRHLRIPDRTGPDRRRVQL